MFKPRDWHKAQAIQARPLQAWPLAPEAWRETRPDHLARAEAQARISKALGEAVSISKAEAKILEAQGYSVAPRAEAEASAYNASPKVALGRKAKLGVRAYDHNRRKALAQAIRAEAQAQGLRLEARPQAEARPLALISWYEPIRLIRESQALLEAQDRALEAQARAEAEAIWSKTYPASIPYRPQPKAKPVAPQPEAKPVAPKFIPLEAWRYVIRLETETRNRQRARSFASLVPQASSLPRDWRKAKPEAQPLRHSARPLGKGATLFGSLVQTVDLVRPEAWPQAYGVPRLSPRARR